MRRVQPLAAQQLADLARRAAGIGPGKTSSLYFAVNDRRLACSTSSGSGTPAGAARPPSTAAPFVLVCNIPTFSILALKVHCFLDGERLAER